MPLFLMLVGVVMDMYVEAFNRFLTILSCIIIFGPMVWILSLLISEIWGFGNKSNAPYQGRMSDDETDPIEESSRPINHRTRVKSTIHNPGIFGSGDRRIEVDERGSVRKAQVFGFGEVLAHIDSHGTIRKDAPLTFGGEVIGQIDEDGTIREAGYFGGGRVIAKVGEDGLIRDNLGNVLGEIEKHE